MSKYIVLVITFLSFNTFAGTLADDVHPIASLDFNSSLDDVSFFGDLVKDSKIVALGETVHTNGSFHQANAKLAKFLVERKGFRNLLIETPWYQARFLSQYTKDCSASADIVNGLQTIFPQFSSVELSELYSWVHNFNCAHPNDQVTLLGFDIQQISFNSNTAIAFDVMNLEQFVNSKVPDMVSRLPELRLCGPGPSSWANLGPSTADDLAKCQKFLSDLLPIIQSQTYKRFSLESSVIALKHSSAMFFYSATDKVASSGWRDLGMAEMIKLIVSNLPSDSKTVVIAHLYHVARNAQQLVPFATKSMGTYLGDMYGSNYFVSAAVSYRSAVTPWFGDKFYDPSPNSFEGVLNALNVGSLLLDMKVQSVADTSAVHGISDSTGVIMSAYWDSMIFIPTSKPMTNYPGVTYPQKP